MVIVFVIVIIGDLFLFSLFFLFLAICEVDDRCKDDDEREEGREGGNECRYTREERKIDKSINQSILPI